ncbi:MAG: 2-hydroxyacyl-CoA dehydratase [Bacteroidales bacterium]|nr:2-hydroxyacyl-CoA dehydratase [Bacteroidales bacterium]
MAGRLKATKRMKKIMRRYYTQAKYAHLFGKKVAWITSGGPVEPLIAMNIIPVYPENHGAMIGASKMGGKLSEFAEGMGYSQDVCSYAKGDITSSITKESPIPGGLPKPDLLVCSNNICGTVLKWYEIQARKFNVPLFIYDTPFVHTEFTQEAKEYVDAQTQEYIQFLERVTGKKFNHKRMKKVWRLSLKSMHLWKAVLETAEHKPSPMTAFDAFFHLALIVTLRGKKTVVRYYQLLLKELKERTEQDVGAVENEKYRLLWDNLPIWFRMRWLSEKFAGHQAALVADTYTQAWCGVIDYIDENDYMSSLGEAYTRIHLNVGVDQMAETIKKFIKQYNVDGLVMHSNRSCKPYSFGQYDIQNLLREMDIPVLILEADMTDERKFSESQAETRIDAFMEMIKQKKN